MRDGSNCEGSEQERQGYETKNLLGNPDVGPQTSLVVLLQQLSAVFKIGAGRSVAEKDMCIRKARFKRREGRHTISETDTRS